MQRMRALVLPWCSHPPPVRLYPMPPLIWTAPSASASSTVFRLRQPCLRAAFFTSLLRTSLPFPLHCTHTHIYAFLVHFLYAGPPTTPTTPTTMVIEMWHCSAARTTTTTATATTTTSLPHKHPPRRLVDGKSSGVVLGGAVRCEHGRGLRW